MTKPLPAPLSPYAPNARADLLASLCCTPEGLHLLGVLYKDWSIHGSNPDWLAEPDSITPSEFRSNCSAINFECRSLKSLIETRAANKSQQDKFSDVIQALAKVPAKDEVLAALAAFILHHAEKRNAVLDSVASARLALQNNLDIETKAQEEEIAFQAERGLKVERIVLRSLPNIALLARQSIAPGSQTEIIATRRLIEIHGRDTELGELTETELPDPYELFWTVGRHDRPVEKPEGEEKRARGKKSPAIVLLDKELIDPKVQYALSVLADIIAQKFNLDPDTITTAHAAKYIAKAVRVSVGPVQTSMPDLCKGNITKLSGQLCSNALNLAQTIGMLPEEAFPDVTFVDSPASEQLRTLIYGRNNEATKTMRQIPLN